MILVVNHFGLDTVCGTTVMFRELLRIAPRATDVRFAYASLADHDPKLDDVACVVSINAHIEVAWAQNQALFADCRRRGIPAWLYAHDYWPQHRPAVDALVALGARVIASTPFVASQLAAIGHAAQVVEVGVPLPDAWPAPIAPALPPTVATAGRIVSRKRVPDVVRGFAASGMDRAARLYLRVLPSQVFGADADANELRAIEGEIALANLASVEVDRTPGERPDYARYAVYVQASFYEGFSMTVIEAAFAGCPPLMSHIPPHITNAGVMFGDRADDFLFDVGDTAALGALIRDELSTGRRRAWLAERLPELQGTIASRFSLARMARELASLVNR